LEILRLKSLGDYETASTDDFGFAFSPTVFLTSTKDNLFYIHEALQKIKEQNGDNSTIGIQYSLNLFSRKEYESKKEILDRIRKRFYEDSDIIRFSLGGTRYHQFERLLNSEPFDESAVPGSLVKKLKAKEDYLLLMFSPSDKNFFNVKNVYQLAREIETLKSMLADRNIHTSIMNENLLAAKVLDWVKEKGPRAMVIAVIIISFNKYLCRSHYLLCNSDLSSTFLVSFKTQLDAAPSMLNHNGISCNFDGNCIATIV